MDSDAADALWSDVRMGPGQAVIAATWSAVRADPEPLEPHQVHREVDGRLTAALQVQPDGVLPELVVHERVVVSGMDLPHARDAALDDRDLV